MTWGELHALYVLGSDSAILEEHQPNMEDVKKRILFPPQGPLTGSTYPPPLVPVPWAFWVPLLTCAESGLTLLDTLSLAPSLPPLWKP